MAIHRGSCFCGQTKYEFDDSTILLSAYCHCTNCQRLTSGSSVHSIHVPEASFKLLTTDVHSFAFVSKSRKERKRCKNCGTQFASYNVDKKAWSIWSATLLKEEGAAVPASLAATAHMFYGTRVYDANDDLGKWSGYEGKSERIA